MQTEPQPLRISTADGATLAGTLYTPGQARAAVMIAPATGIRRGFYDPFARHLQSLGFGVITFENRGIGESLHGRLRDSDATLVSWGRGDMPAVLDQLATTFPGVSYHLVGHSAGGQLVGLMPNATELRSFVAVASSSGSLRNMRPLYRAQANFFLNVLLPLTCRFQGVGRSDLVGMGGPLPRGVSRDWGRWCSGRGYVEEALRADPTLSDHLYDAIDMPSLWLHATDDDIANHANVQDMIRVHSRLRVDVRALDPAHFDVGPIGHMNFFRREALWPEATDWLEQTLG